MLRGISPLGKILLATGRISSEMLRKAAHMGTPFVVSRTSATTLSIDLGMGDWMGDVRMGDVLD